MHSHNEENGGIPYMGITKLIKLVYIAHGFFLGKNNRPLINDQVEAWHYGPALRLLYGTLKEEEDKIDFRDILAGSEDEAKEILENQDVMEIINDVITRYRKHTALELTNITHKAGTPWEVSIRSGNLSISNNLIQQYYAKRLSNQSHNTI